MTTSFHILSYSLFTTIQLFDAIYKLQTPLNELLNHFHSLYYTEDYDV
jgi:hypothetical protein